MGARRSRNFLGHTNIKWRQKPECSAQFDPVISFAPTAGGGGESSAVPQVRSNGGVEQEAALGLEKMLLPPDPVPR